MADLIKNYIERLIAKQIDEHGVVVWYDPEGNYKDLLPNIDLSKCPILKFEGSYYDLRFKAENYFEGIDKKQLLVYLNTKRDTQLFPLIELEKAGCVVESEGTVERNTNLTVVVREALRGNVSDELVSDICKKVDEKTITIPEIEKITENARSINTASLSIIFNTNDPQSIILEFLTNNELDKAIIAKKVDKEIERLIQVYLGIETVNGLSILEMRDKVGEVALMLDFVDSFKSPITKDKYKSLKLPESPAHISSIKSLVALWRNTPGKASLYIKKAEAIQQIYSIPAESYSYKDIIDTHTFPVIDGMLINACLTQSDVIPLEEIELIASKRKNAFWANNKGEYSLIWIIIEYGCYLQKQILAAMADIKQKELPFTELINLYVNNERKGWFLIDKQYRSLEAKYSEFDIGNVFDEELEKFVANIRALYSRFLDIQTNAVSSNISWKELSAQLKQKDILKEFVLPVVESKKKCAYFLVDAFRFEMGEELYESIENSEKKEIKPALSSVPTITPFGMLTLLLSPGEEVALNTSKGKLSIEVSENKVNTRSERLKYFAEKYSLSIESFKLEEVIKPKKSVRDKIKKADLVIITSQEIDSLCEGGESLLARQVMSQIILNLKRAIYHLSELGIEDFVVSADHGFLLGNEVGKELKIDIPTGDTCGLHKRVWIGMGGNNPENTVRFKASDFGYVSDLDFVIPKGLSVFKTPGSENDYFHGGLSLQELIIPVLTFQMKPSPKQKKSLKEDYVVELSKPVITNRIFTLTIQYKVEELIFADMLTGSKKVRLNILKDQEQIGQAVASEYGFDEATNEIVLERNRKNVITVILNENISEGNVSIVVVDSRTELEPAKMVDIPVKIVF